MARFLLVPVPAEWLYGWGSACEPCSSGALRLQLMVTGGSLPGQIVPDLAEQGEFLAS